MVLYGVIYIIILTIFKANIAFKLFRVPFVYPEIRYLSIFKKR